MNEKKQNVNMCPNMDGLQNIMQVKEARLQRLHIVWFHLHEINVQQTQIYRDIKHHCLELGVGAEIKSNLVMGV